MDVAKYRKAKSFSTSRKFIKIEIHVVFLFLQNLFLPFMHYFMFYDKIPNKTPLTILTSGPLRFHECFCDVFAIKITDLVMLLHKYLQRTL